MLDCTTPKYDDLCPVVRRSLCGVICTLDMYEEEMTTILVSTDSDGLVFRVQKEDTQQSDLPRKVFVGIDPDKFRQYDAVATLLTGSLTEGVEFRDAITDRLVKSLF